MIERKINRLNEEISRWAFEIKVEKLPDWKIIFTNPTAGPWKKIMCTDEHNNIGEVYRFLLEEERPDIIMINDKLESILIIEAKDSLEKLLEKKQLQKTVEVTQNMAKIFKGKKDNKYWGKRANYKTYLGLLWGSETQKNEREIKFLFEEHLKISKNKNDICNTIFIGIETIYKPEKNFIKCIPHYYYNEQNELINLIINSLSIIIDL